MGCLLQDAGEWINLKKDLQAHIEKLWELWRKFESEKILQSELSTSRKTNTKEPKPKGMPVSGSNTMEGKGSTAKQPGEVKITTPSPIIALRKQIERFAKKKEGALSDIRTQTKDMIGLVSGRENL